MRWTDCLPAGILGTLGMAAGPAIWVHEMGHVVAARVLQDGPAAEVVIRPFVGGRAHVHAGPPSALGQALGPETSRLLIAAAGPLADLLLGMALVAVGFLALGRMRLLLVGTGFGVAFLPVVYAATAACGLASPLNDFARIEAGSGLPPLASALLLGLVVPLQYRALRGGSRPAA